MRGTATLPPKPTLSRKVCLDRPEQKNRKTLQKLEEEESKKFPISTKRPKNFFFGYEFEFNLPHEIKFKLTFRTKSSTGNCFDALIGN